MLPYHLRAPRYGDKEETFRRRRDATNPPTEHDGGGPIQVAITIDLINLRQQFRGEILNYHQTRKQTKNQPRKISDDDIHWKSGTAFSIFKDVFRSSRIAMIHLLPPARCDREAYNQLIYAACLALFKESFNKIISTNLVDDFPLEEDEEGENNSCDDGCNYHDDAGFAIFSLYSLFKTNPLPRQINGNNPLEHLPVSLRSLGDDPRTNCRRCFSQNIRTDRQQFTMLLRLKELSLAKKCDCERYFYQLNKKQRFLWECRCGMYTDILEIIERIVPRLELCEYTGPFGIEAFAGHADYPYNNYKKKGTSHQECKGISIQSEEEGGYSIEFLPELSNDFVCLIKNYQKSITAIRIPSSKSNAVKRLQKVLEPIFSSNNIEQRDNTNRSSSISVQNYSNVQTQRGQNYKVILHDEIGGGNLKKHLHASLMFLLRRDEPIPIQLDLAHHPSSTTSLAIGDASSIRHGGVSVGTNQGQIAIQDLLSVVAGKDKVTRKSRLKKLAIEEEEENSDQNLAHVFLTSNQPIDHVASSDDEDSVDSELTTLSFSHKEIIEEDGDDEISVVSVATSTFGTKALEDLLYTVAQEEEIAIIPTKKRKRKTITKKTKNQNKKKIDCNQDDETSVATSAFGTKALEDLLHTVAQQQQDVNGDAIIPAKRTKRKSVTKNAGKNQKKKRIENDRDDEISVATIAFGTKALQDLLHIVAQEEKKMDGDVNVLAKRKLVARKTKNQNKRVIDRNQDDEISVATSACGKKALKDLLQAVNQEEANGDRNFTISTCRTKQKTIPKQAKKKNIFDQHQYDGISVATSDCGKRALEDLLQTVNQEKC